MRRLAQAIRKTDGAEIAEAALVLPIVFLFLLGIVWFGRAFNIYSTIQQAAQQGAITAARPVCATCGSPTCVWGSGFPCDTTVVNRVAFVLQASNLDPTLIPVNTNIPTPGFCPVPPPPASPAGACSTTIDNVTICRDVLVNPAGTPSPTPVCGTLVSFQYPFQFYLPFTSLNLTQITLNAQAQSRMEN